MVDPAAWGLGGASQTDNPRSRGSTAAPCCASLGRPSVALLPEARVTSNARLGTLEDMNLHRWCTALFLVASCSGPPAAPRRGDGDVSSADGETGEDPGGNPGDLEADNDRWEKP